METGAVLNAGDINVGQLTVSQLKEVIALTHHRFILLFDLIGSQISSIGKQWS